MPVWFVTLNIQRQMIWHRRPATAVFVQHFRPELIRYYVSTRSDRFALVDSPRPKTGGNDIPATTAVLTHRQSYSSPAHVRLYFFKSGDASCSSFTGDNEPRLGAHNSSAFCAA